MSRESICFVREFGNIAKSLKHEIPNNEINLSHFKSHWFIFNLVPLRSIYNVHTCSHCNIWSFEKCKRFACIYIKWGKYEFWTMTQDPLSIVFASSLIPKLYPLVPLRSYTISHIVGIIRSKVSLSSSEILEWRHDVLAVIGRSFEIKFRWSL